MKSLGELTGKPMEVISLRDDPTAAAFFRDTGMWPKEDPLAMVYVQSVEQVRRIANHSDDFLFGDRQKVVQLPSSDGNDPDRIFVIFDPGDFLHFLDEHALLDGDEVSLPRHGRIFLMDCLGGNRHHRRRTMRKKTKMSGPTGSRAFAAEDGDIVPDGSEDHESQARPGTDACYPDDQSRPLTDAQKKVIRDIHVNCGHPSKE